MQTYGAVEFPFLGQLRRSASVSNERPSANSWCAIVQQSMYCSSVVEEIVRNFPRYCIDTLLYVVENKKTSEHEKLLDTIFEEQKKRAKEWCKMWFRALSRSTHAKYAAWERKYLLSSPATAKGEKVRAVAAAIPPPPALSVGQVKISNRSPFFRQPCPQGKEILIFHLIWHWIAICLLNT